MGKKTKKTKWRTLEIPSPGKRYESAAANARWHDGRPTSAVNHQQHCDKIFKGHKVASTMSSTAISSSNSTTFSSSREGHVKTLIEDEYTKITTPRQDVLFKKGYLSKRKMLDHACGESTSDNDIDGIAQQDCTNSEDFSSHTNGADSLPQLVCAAPQSYIDPSSAVYYGGGYEIYDPYTGSVTAVVVGASAGQPLLTSMPCRPVPLQPVQWFNPVPSSDWCCSYAQQNVKLYSTDSQNEYGGSGVSSESSCAPESPASTTDDQANNDATSSCTFPSSYVYPGYMFGPPAYNVDGVNIQYCTAENTVLSGSEAAITKKKKKRKRRRRVGETEDGSESSVDETCNRSVSSSECVLDCRSQEEFTNYNDNLQNGSSHLNFQAHGYESDLPHANVNAPPFIPATATAAVAVAAVTTVGATAVAVGNARNSFATYGVSCMDQLEEVSALSDNPFSNTVINDRLSKNEIHIDDNTTSSSAVNVYCKSYTSVKNKLDNDVGSSSNNSDSGISSPGSEDSSLPAKDFRNFATSERTKLSGNAENNISVTRITGRSAGVTAIEAFDIAVSCTSSSHFSSMTTTTSVALPVNTNTYSNTVPITTNNVAICSLAGHESIGTTYSDNKSRCYKIICNREITDDDSKQSARDDCEKNVTIDKNEQGDQCDEKSKKKNRSKKSIKVKNKSLARCGDEKCHEPSNIDHTDRTECRSLEDVKNDKFSVEDLTARPNTSTINRVENKNSKDSHISKGNESRAQIKTGISKDLPADYFQDETLINPPPNYDDAETEFKTNKFSEENIICESARSNVNDEDLNCSDDYTSLRKSMDSYTATTFERSVVDENNVPPVISDSHNFDSSQTTEHHHLISKYDRCNVVEQSYFCDQNPSVIGNAVDQLIRIEKKPLLAKLVEIEQQLEDNEKSITNLVELSFSSFTPCRDYTNSTSSYSLQHIKYTRQMIETAAQSVVDEIIQQAELRIYSTMKCDTFQLPITQAVTNWLNERGGLPTVETGQNDSHELLEPVHLKSSRSKKSTKSNLKSKSTRSRTGCIIC